MSFTQMSNSRDASAAKALLISGVNTPPTTTLNGKQLDNLESRVVNGQKAWVVPLRWAVDPDAYDHNPMRRGYARRSHRRGCFDNGFQLTWNPKCCLRRD